jgi:hypothetical protein
MNKKSKMFLKLLKNKRRLSYKGRIRRFLDKNKSKKKRRKDKLPEKKLN